MSAKVEHFDAIIIGGGPAGSTCASTLSRAGLRIAVVDRAEFPRVKLCAGWISPRIWDVLQMSPHDYPGGIWEWHACHVRYGEHEHTLPGHGWFIRRYELDDYLLRRSGAKLHLGVTIQQIERDADGWWTVAGLRTRVLVGAAGTHCPVARLLAPPRPRGPVGAQELELRAGAVPVARSRIGADGEPELFLFDDAGGYGWNVPKSEWLNVGCGTLDATRVRTAWQETRALLRATGHVPEEAATAFDRVKGHSYYLFDPAHLSAAARVDEDGRGGAFLIGDALGLAHPITAEGILPAALSGRLFAEAMIEGELASYPDRLREESLFADYARVRALMALAMPRWFSALGGNARIGALRRRSLVRGFAWMFSGAALPAPRLLDFMLAHSSRS